MPRQSPVLRWMLDEKRKDFREHSTLQARDIQADMISEETIEIADEAPSVMVGDQRGVY